MVFQVIARSDKISDFSPISPDPPPPSHQNSFPLFSKFSSAQSNIQSFRFEPISSNLEKDSIGFLSYVLLSRNRLPSVAKKRLVDATLSGLSIDARPPQRIRIYHDSVNRSLIRGREVGRGTRRGLSSA